MKPYGLTKMRRLSSLDEKIDWMSKFVNKCFEDHYDYYYKQDKVEFKGCCDENEKKLLIKCYNIYTENEPTLDKDEVLIAVIIYYYNTIVLEYYINENLDILRSQCFRHFSSPEIMTIRDRIATGDEEWLSSIRKIMLNINVEPFKAGKRRKYTIKKRNSKKKKYLCSKKSRRFRK